MAGVFIAFEGGEGAGKSTQARRLSDTLREHGFCAVLLREPGSTELGEYLREYLVAERPVSPLAELLMFEAARAQLMAEKVIEPLEAGSIVIADRFTGSTIAYQGYGRGIDLSRIEWLNDFATGRRYPDLTVLLDVDPAIGLNRVKARQLSFGLLNVDTDRFEDADIAFHNAVRCGFRKQAVSNPTGWQTLEGNHSIEDVAAKVWELVFPMLANRSHPV